MYLETFEQPLRRREQNPKQMPTRQEVTGKLLRLRQGVQCVSLLRGVNGRE